MLEILVTDPTGTPSTIEEVYPPQRGLYYHQYLPKVGILTGYEEHTERVINGTRNKNVLVVEFPNSGDENDALWVHNLLSDLRRKRINIPVLVTAPPSHPGSIDLLGMETNSFVMIKPASPGKLEQALRALERSRIRGVNAMYLHAVIDRKDDPIPFEIMLSSFLRSMDHSVERQGPSLFSPVTGMVSVGGGEYPATVTATKEMIFPNFYTGGRYIIHCGNPARLFQIHDFIIGMSGKVTGKKGKKIGLHTEYSTSEHGG